MDKHELAARVTGAPELHDSTAASTLASLLPGRMSLVVSHPTLTGNDFAAAARAALVEVIIGGLLREAGGVFRTANGMVIISTGIA